MDFRRILVFVALSGLIILGWNRFLVQPALERQREMVARQQQAAREQPEERPAAPGDQPGDADAPVEAPRPGEAPRIVAADPQPVVEPAAMELPRHPRHDNIHLGSLDPDSGYFMRATVTTRGAAVRQIELNGHEDLENKGQPLTVIDTVEVGDRLEKVPYRTFQTAIPALDKLLAEHGTSLSEVDWELMDPPPADDRAPRSSVTFRYAIPGAPLEVLKRYTLERIEAKSAKELARAREENSAGYELKMALGIRNTTAQPETVRYEFVGPVGLPLENLAYARKFSDFKIGVINGSGVSVDYMASATIAKTVQDQIERAARDGRRLTAPEASLQLQEWQQPFRFAGIDVQFFAGLIAPPEGKKLIAEVRPLLLERASEPAHSQISALFTSDEFALEPGGELSHQYRLFAGPKQQDLLAAYQAGDIVEFGWFAILSKGMLWLLNLFHGMGLPYAIAIVCLTAVVRGAMFPLSKKQALAAARMKELQPQLQEIKKRYGDDKQKATQAQMELFRKANYNPFAGCLPIFLQLPIFIGLYNGLYCSVELRNASFLWIDNLAAPDALFRFPWGATPWLGWTTFNLLPILTVVLFIVQQKMFMPPPAADDEQAKLTYRMMNIMMVVMGFIFYGVPAGLCLYFIVSSLWGIGERKLLDHVKRDAPQPEPASESTAPAAARPAAAGQAKAQAQANGDAKKGLWARLVEMADAAQSQRNEQKAADGKSANGAGRPGGGGPRTKKRGKKSKRR